MRKVARILTFLTTGKLGPFTTDFGLEATNKLRLSMKLSEFQAFRQLTQVGI
jgi:hypothetical protein